MYVPWQQSALAHATASLDAQRANEAPLDALLFSLPHYENAADIFVASPNQFRIDRKVTKFAVLS